MTGRTTNRPRTLILTALAASGAAALLFGPAGEGGLVAPALAQQVKPEDLAADYERSLENAAKDSAKAYESLYKWCVKEQLNFTAINTRRLVLRYDPHNEEIRKFVGYAKGGDGTWIRNDARRDAIREEADIEDPKAKKFPEKLLSTNKTVIGKWKALATKAKKNGEQDAANAAAWAEKSKAAWERVLQVDSSNEEAHKALNHPKFNGKYCRPEAMPFLKVRDERKQGGLKRANTPFKTAPAELAGGVIANAGLTGGAAKSERFAVDSVHGKDHAAKLAQWAERCLVDYVAVYGVPEDVKDRLPWRKYNIVKDQDQLKKLLSVVPGWDGPRIEKFVKFFGGGSHIPEGECTSTSSANADSEDYVIHYTGHAVAYATRNMAVQDVGSPNEGLEDWLLESIAYDITRRLTGTTLTTCGAFGKYGTDLDPHPDKDIWIELARRLVEYDDDVPLSRLWKCKHENQDFRGPETVKGYAFLQFVFESDPEKGRKFLWHALAQGTPRAIEDVYGDAIGDGGDGGGAEGTGGAGTTDGTSPTMEKVDAEYRKWILSSW